MTLVIPLVAVEIVAPELAKDDMAPTNPFLNPFKAEPPMLSEGFKDLNASEIDSIFSLMKSIAPQTVFFITPNILKLSPISSVVDLIIFFASTIFFTKSPSFDAILSMNDKKESTLGTLIFKPVANLPNDLTAFEMAGSTITRLNSETASVSFLTPGRSPILPNASERLFLNSFAACATFSNITFKLPNG